MNAFPLTWVKFEPDVVVVHRLEKGFCLSKNLSKPTRSTLLVSC